MNTTTKTLRVSGPTYEIREILKANGGQYDGATKTWKIAAAGWAYIMDNYSFGSNKRDRARATAVNGCTVEEIA